MGADFDDIVAPLKGSMPNFPKDINMPPSNPELTPGEGGAFGLAALMLGAGLLADLSEMVQMTALICAAVLGVAGVLMTGKIRKARNNTEAARAMGGSFEIAEGEE